MTRVPGLIAVGRITRAHGVSGEVAVLPLSEVPSRFEPGSTVFAGESEERPLRVVAARPHRQRLLVSFQGIDDRAQAESLRGEYLFVVASSAPQLPAGQYWTHQLIGCDVKTENGAPIGRIREIIHTLANDVWAATGPLGEVLIPALKDVVVEVDLEARRVVVRDIPGLTAP